MKRIEYLLVAIAALSLAECRAGLEAPRGVDSTRRGRAALSTDCGHRKGKSTVTKKRSKKPAKDEGIVAPPTDPGVAEGPGSEPPLATGEGELGTGATSGEGPEVRETFTGPRGGRYHYSASGKKVYEKKRK